MKKNIAVSIANYIQYINIKPGLDKLIDKGYEIDIYCPKIVDDDGFNNIFEDNVKILKENGYKVYRKPQKSKKYKVLLEPYPCLNIESKYKIKYRYGNISAKPNIVYSKIQEFILYDAILCSGIYDSNYLSIFSKTYITGNMKYINFKKKKCNKGKPILLYLPTYGECSSIDIIGNHLEKLRKKYYIIAKIHHGTCFLKSEAHRINTIKNNVDEFYDLHKNLSELLAIADVVLSDNSGSIFEALYTEVPVAVFSNDINQNKWGNFNTTQYELFKEGILPYTNKLDELGKILKEAQSTKIKKLQSSWSQKNLYHPKDQVVDFVNVVEKYLNDEIDKRHFDFHTEFKNDYLKLFAGNIENLNNINTLKKENEKLKSLLNNKDEKIKNINQEINELQGKINFLTNTVNYYKNGKLYKLANKIYRLKNGEK